MRYELPLITAAFTLLGACASKNGTRPADMTVAEHEAAAESSQAASRAHGSQYDPAARGEHCKYFDVNCARYWTSEVNPTARHLREAKQHRELAARHRSASSALRQTEQRACAGLAEPDRDISPFYHREDIDRVERIQREVPPPGGGTTPLQPSLSEPPIGARVVFRARPGMTAEWLQRVVDCHIARWGALGGADPNAPSCPLALRGVSATVLPVRGGFAVEIVASDQATAAAVIGRAEALVQSS